MTPQPPIDRQREHQANERTFLAWLRTSIALISFGFAIARFALFLRQLQATTTGQEVIMHPVFSYENFGIVMVILGVVTIALAAWQYNRVFWQIERGNYRPNRLMVWSMTALVITLGLISIPLMVWRTYESRSSPSSTKLRSSRSSYDPAMPFWAMHRRR
ncbi:YidH family protein [Pantanalinema rosaneae CENA516]|uniref:YidH family protein n=1 Tax=Pantanalinema rosaneae TaxID=1620701 RepID=UPI003D6FEAA2